MRQAEASMLPLSLDPVPLRQPDEARNRRGRLPAEHYDWVVAVYNIAMHQAPGKEIQWLTANVEYTNKDGEYTRPSASTVHRWLNDAGRGRDGAGAFALSAAIRARIDATSGDSAPIYP